MNDDELHPVVKVIVALAAIATMIWATWCTVIAFIGGTMPIIGWETEGSLGFGLLWLFLLEPIAVTVAYWITMIVTMPLAMLLDARRR